MTTVKHFIDLAQLRLLLLQSFLLAVLQGKSIQFFHLITQQLNAGFGLVCVLPPLFQFLVGVAPGFPGCPGIVGKGFRAGKLIQQFSVGVLAQQGLVLVLAVNVHQHAAQFLELGKRTGLAVNEGSGAALLADATAQDAVFGVIQFLLFQPVPGLGNARNVKACGNVGPLGAMAYRAGIRTTTHGQPQGIKNN